MSCGPVHTRQAGTQPLEGVDRSPSAFARALKHAAKAANTKINSYAVAHPENRGMGTSGTVDFAARSVENGACRTMFHEPVLSSIVEPDR